MARLKAGNSQIQSDSVVSFEKPGQGYDGYFLGTNKFKGNFGDSTAHNFLGEDGTVSAIYGTKVLDDLMSEVQIGAHAWVVYKGKKKTKNGNLAKIWDVEWDNEDVLDSEALAAATALKAAQEDDSDDSDDDSDDAVQADEAPTAKDKRTPTNVTKSSADKMNNLLKNRRATQ